MAVMTYAQNQVTEANYNHLDVADQDRFDHVMELADDNRDNGEYLALMLAAASIAGLRIPYGGHVRKCACSCVCGVIFDPEHPDARCIEDEPGFNLGRHQCPTCADRHRETA